MVQFWVCNGFVYVDDVKTFQFHYGAILGARMKKQSTNFSISIPLWCNFGSAYGVGDGGGGGFQFHYGAILGELYSYQQRTRQHNFNSTMVQFWGLYFIYMLLFAIYFNSTMVQFWAQLSGLSPRLTSLFQFHYGAILGFIFWITDPSLSYFNSTMVQFWGL